MIIVAEETRSGSRDTRQNKNTGETGAGTESDTETTQTGGRTQTRGPEFGAMSERGMFRTSVSSKRRGSFTTREDGSIDKITRAAASTRIQNSGNLTTNLKKKLLSARRNQTLNCLARF